MSKIVTIFIPSQAGSDHQTFSMTLPYKLRAYYDKVVTPASQAGQTQGGTRARLGVLLNNGTDIDTDIMDGEIVKR